MQLLQNTEGIAWVMIEWIPALIVFALGAASFAIVFMAAMVAIVGFFGYRAIHRAAVSAAAKAADDGLKRHLASEEFKEMVRVEALNVSLKDLFSKLHNQLTSDGEEAGNDQNQS